MQKLSLNITKLSQEGQNRVIFDPFSEIPIYFFSITSQHKTQEVHLYFRTPLKTMTSNVNRTLLTDTILPITINPENLQSVIEYLFKIPRFIFGREYVSKGSAHYRVVI